MLAVAAASSATIRVAGTYIMLKSPTTTQIGYRILKIVTALCCDKSVIRFVISIPPGLLDFIIRANFRVNPLPCIPDN